MIPVLKTCISVLKSTTDFSVVSKAIVLKLGTLLDNMSGYAHVKFHGPHYNSAQASSKSRVSQQPAKTLKNRPFFQRAKFCRGKEMNPQNLSMGRPWGFLSSKSDFHAEARFWRRNDHPGERASGEYCQSKSVQHGLKYTTLNTGSLALPRAITR